MGNREFIYTGGPIPKIDPSAHPAFILHLQKAMLSVLTEKKLLSASQTERVIDALKRRAGYEPL